MKSTISTILIAATFLVATTTQAHDRHAPLNEEQTIFLKQYELARAALANDDLASAKKTTGVVAALTVLHHESSGVVAPPGFVQDARKIMQANSIEAVREIFKSYSRRAVNVADLKSGYYVVHCSVAGNTDQDWVERSPNPGNPYTGDKKSVCP